MTLQQMLTKPEVKLVGEKDKLSSLEKHLSPRTKPDFSGLFDSRPKVAIPLWPHEKSHAAVYKKSKHDWTDVDARI